jgi:hypothetical protein
MAGYAGVGGGVNANVETKALSAVSADVKTMVQHILQGEF